MRKALLLLIPLVLAGLILYAVWESVPEPTTRGQNTTPGVDNLKYTTSRERGPRHEH